MEKVNLTVRLDRELKERVEAACRRQDVTLSQLVRSSFRKFLNQLEELEGRQKTPAEVKRVGDQIAATAAYVRGPGVKSKRGKR